MPEPRRLGGDAGSVLMLMPAGVLVVLVLAAITVDTAIAWMAERELADAAAAAANDAVTFGLDETSYRQTGDYRLDPTRVHAAVDAALAARDSTVVNEATVTVTIDQPTATVTVTLVSAARRVFAPAIGAPNRVAVDAIITARAELRN